MDITAMLLDLGTDINEQQPITQVSSKYSALHVAAQKGNANVVRLLLDRCADLCSHSSVCSASSK